MYKRQILADNFESFEFNNWTSVTRDGDGTASVQTAAVKTGRCAAQLKVTTNTASQANLVKKTPAGTGQVWAQGWFNVLAQGANSNSNVPFFRLFSGTTRAVDVYRANGTGQLYLRLITDTGTTTFQSLGRILAQNTWYHIKVYTDASGATSTVQVSLNGTALRASPAASLNTSLIDSAMIGSEHFVQEGTLAVDDVVINAAT